MGVGEQENKAMQDAASERLWRFATRVYASDGVAAACLEAQDRLGVDVNMLLFASWCASEGVALTEAQIAAADAHCRVWRDGVVLPLRAQRRRWGRSAAESTDTEPACGKEYTAIKALELQAERQQLDFLAAFRILSCEESPAAEAHKPPAAAEILRQDNLAALCRYYALGDGALADACGAIANVPL
jgi:uncharacterized protein (TIGR02444 family)